MAKDKEEGHKPDDPRDNGPVDGGPDGSDHGRGHGGDDRGPAGDDHGQNKTIVIFVNEKPVKVEDVAKLELQRQAAVERVDERTRAAVHNAGASFAGIREAQSAAEWARKNLDLVSEAYARGAVSFIDLLDAQNAHIVADQGAADAVYGFLDDLLEVQRAIGKFGYAMSPEERGDFSRRLHQFAEQAGASTEEE